MKNTKQQLGKWQWHVLVCTVKGENYLHMLYIHICIPGKLYPGITFFRNTPAPLTCVVSGFRGSLLMGGSTASALSFKCLTTGRTADWEVCRCSSGAADPVWSVFGSTLRPATGSDEVVKRERASNFGESLADRSCARVSPANHLRARDSNVPSVWQPAMDEDGGVLPELKDIETKLGRKVPDSLVRSLVGGQHQDEREKSAAAAAAHVTSRKCRSNNADLKRLEGKMLFLKQEMVRN